AGRVGARNNLAIGWLDPFIAHITIPQAGQPDWVTETNFSEGAKSYLTRIVAGPANMTGEIAVNPQAFEAVAAQVPAAGASAVYSPGHDTNTGQDVGEQIGGIAPGATNAVNNLGFDAFAKSGAEGARFEPVRELGTSLKVNSRFFTLNPATDETK